MRFNRGLRIAIAFDLLFGYPRMISTYFKCGCCPKPLTSIFRVTLSGKKLNGDWVWVRDLLCRYWISSCPIRNLDWRARYERFLFVIIYKFVYYFLFSQGNVYWVRFQFQGSLRSYYVPDTSWNGTRFYFPSCWQIFSMPPYENAHFSRASGNYTNPLRPKKPPKPATNFVNLTNWGAQTKSESVGARMTSHLFTACFLLKSTRRLSQSSTSFKLIWHNFSEYK